MLVESSCDIQWNENTIPTFLMFALLKAGITIIAIIGIYVAIVTSNSKRMWLSAIAIITSINSFQFNAHFLVTAHIYNQ